MQTNVDEAHTQTMLLKQIQPQKVRACFPALQRSDFIFFDNAAGAQIPQVVLDAVNHHLLECNVQRGGRYQKSRQVDASIAQARESVAVLLNGNHADEIAFGMNATSFIRIVSLAVGQTLQQRNEIVITDMDHEANIAAWLALQREGATFRWWHVREDGNLHVEDLEPLLSGKTRIVALPVASNAIGSIVNVAKVSPMVHQYGGEVFVDCVHYAPHGLIDVQAFGCDYLVCSGYKIFSPHMGFLWGRYNLLRTLPTFREDFIPDEPPGKLEAGTFVYENVAGMDAAVRYLERLGTDLANGAENKSRRANLVTGMTAIRDYEEMLSSYLIGILKGSGADIYGIQDEDRLSERVPTFLFNLPGVSPERVTDAMAAAGIGVRDGHMYSPRLMRRLGLPYPKGAVRASLVHYNTKEEIAQFGSVLATITPDA